MVPIKRVVSAAATAIAHDAAVYTRNEADFADVAALVEVRGLCGPRRIRTQDVHLVCISTTHPTHAGRWAEALRLLGGRRAVRRVRPHTELRAAVSSSR